MYNIKHTNKSILSLKKFIDSYKNSFIGLINDSGLYFEEVMIQNYINIGDKLYENIVNKIELKLEKNIILGRSLIKDDKNYVVIVINSFRVFIYYTENINLNERYIENIEFCRK